MRATSVLILTLCIVATTGPTAAQQTSSGKILDPTISFQAERTKEHLFYPPPRQGDGSGGNVLNLEVMQILYSDPTFGNAVFVLWEETTPNLSGVNVYEVTELGESLVDTVAGLTVDRIPGINFTQFANLPIGAITYRVEGIGTPASAQDSIVIVANSPLEDVPSVTCQQGPSSDGGATCNLVITWTLPPTIPSYYGISVADAFDSQIGASTQSRDGNAIVEVFNGASPSSYIASIVPFLATDNGLYRGEFTDSEQCAVDCQPTCTPPVAFELCQLAYGPEATNNLVEQTWTNTGAYTEFNFFLDGSSVMVADEFDLAAERFNFESVPPGMHSFEAEGVCDTQSSGQFAFDFEVLTSTPHTSPTQGPVIAEHLEADILNPEPRTVLRWANDAPSRFIDVLRVVDDELSLVRRLAGNETMTTVMGTTPEDTIVLQFFITAGEFCYGSELIVAEPPGNLFIRGMCDQSGRDFPDISTAIFLFQWLFTDNSFAPTCPGACDVNADGGADISDGIYILSFRFAGGPPPVGWPDLETPLCELFPLDGQLGCPEAHPNCL